MRLGGRWGAPAAAIGGALAALASPPFGVLIGVFGFALVMLALDARDPAHPWRSGFLRGWAAGFGYLAVSTSWIGEPFLIDAAEHAWQAPFAMALTPGLIGLIWGGAGLLYAALRPRGALRVLAFASLFAAAEWVRGHLFTGFPWDLPGETWRAGSGLSQGAALIGAYGLTWITLALGAAPAVLADPRASRGAQLALLAAAAASVGALGFWGDARHAPPPAAGSARAPVFRLVQPNLPELPTWSDAVLEQTVDSYTRLTAAPSATLPAVVVWPEGAIPAAFNDYLAPGAEARARIEASLAPGQSLLVGGYRESESAHGSVYNNSLLALRRAPDGALAFEALYDKHHLVPFGEYMPLRWLLAPLGLRKLVSVSTDFTPGPPPRTIVVAGLRLQPLICYEALFPELAAGDRRARPRALVNISDDAWFGRHAGPWQHFNLASYRAIEQGLPMARDTPTGVTGMIDAFGRPASRLLAPGAAGVVDAALPPALGPTPYARWREAPFVALILIGLTARLGAREVAGATRGVWKRWTSRLNS